MGHSLTSTVLEQLHLLGGSDLLAPSADRTRRARRIHVDEPTKVGFAAALALVVAHGKKARAPALKMSLAQVPSRTRCPRCGIWGDTVQDFGTRVVRGQRRPQSWCRSCRSAHAPAQPRPAPVEPGLLFPM